MGPRVPGERGAGGPSQCRRAALLEELWLQDNPFTRRAWCGTTGPTSAHRVGRLQPPRSLRMERVFLKAETDGKYRRNTTTNPGPVAPRVDGSCQGAG